MRWQGLFDDLEAQAQALRIAERGAEIDERTRTEVGALPWLDRLRASLGTRVRLRIAGDGVTLQGTVRRVGPDWVLIEQDAGREAVVATAAVLGLRGLGRYTAVPGTDSVVASRLGLRSALRGIARDRSVVRLQLTDGSTVDATIDRVGADFIEVAAHAAGEARRREAVREVELVPLGAVAIVSRQA